MSRFNVGDVVVCIEDRPMHHGLPTMVVKGYIYRIDAVDDGSDGEGQVVSVEGVAKIITRRFEWWLCANRFRKLDAPQSEVADRIRACKPQRNRVPA